MNNIPRIKIPSPSIRRIDNSITRNMKPPIVGTLPKPSINVPNVRIEYPTIDAPIIQEYQGQMSPPAIPQIPQQETLEEDDTREMGEGEPIEPKVEVPPATITIAGVEAPLPEPAPLITAGATAVVTTAVTLTAGILVGQFKKAVLEPMLKRMENPKKKKIKIKQVKPVLHYILNDEGKVDILEYSQKGTKVVGSTEDVERYIRDKVEDNSLYEMDNKIIIDDVIKDKFTKEGAKRFKSLFAPAKSVAKKLASKFSF